MSRIFIAFTIAYLLTGCAVGPDYHEPKIAVPKQWSGAGSLAKKAQPDQWWQTFNDKELDGLMKEAIAANLDLKQALMRVKDARAQRSATIATGLPSVDARNAFSRRYNNQSGGGQGGGGGNQGGGFGVGNTHINIFQLGFDAQWELDFFGGVRRAIEVADATIESEVENSRDVLLTIQGEVARNYMELRVNQQLAEITKNNLAAQRETQRLTQIRQQAGLVSQLDVAQAQAQADTTEAQLPTYEALAQQAIYALSILLGREPAALVARLGQVKSIPNVSNKIVPDLPSELLKRRPDIRYAERQLAKANATIGVATAELYPKVNLAAFIGLQNTTITDFTPVGKSWSAASTITLPIFNWGKLNANIKSKKAQFEQAFYAYQSTVLTAFKEVEDALVANLKEQQRYHSLLQAVGANELAVALANERYHKGLTGFLDVLQTQQALYQTQSQLVTSAGNVSSNQVALYKVLGGGWQTEASVNGAMMKPEKLHKSLVSNW